VTLVSIQPLQHEHSGDQWKKWEGELKRAKNRLKFFNGPVTFSLPSDYATIKLCEIDADERALDETIQWEFSQQILGPLDEYQFDYQAVPGQTSTGTKKVLVAAYRKDLVARTNSMIRKARLSPRIGDLDIFGLINVFEVNYPDRIESPCLLVHAEPQSTRFVLTQNGGFLDFHCFEYAINFGDPTVPAVSLAAEVELFLAESEKTYGTLGVYAAGSFFQQEETRRTFLGKLPGAEMLNPFRKIKCQVAVEEKQLEEFAAQLAVAVGLALRGSDK
jgi:Tfp pilus assembly PilM family ATPase